MFNLDDILFLLTFTGWDLLPTSDGLVQFYLLPHDHLLLRVHGPLLDLW